MLIKAGPNMKIQIIQKSFAMGVDKIGKSSMRNPFCPDCIRDLEILKSLSLLLTFSISIQAYFRCVADVHDKATRSYNMRPHKGQRHKA
jgi:hypothetical protein